MTHSAQTKNTDYDEAITVALLDALCSPQLYEIVMRDGELFIKPRPHMHPQPPAQTAV